MTFTAWRITKRKHAQTAFDGSGARKFGGRWNSPGIAIVYAAQSQSLAVLEMLVHLDGPSLLQQYVLIPVEIDAGLIRTVEIGELPRDWQSHPAPPALRDVGDTWVRSSASVALKLPSALLPAESNFLLNPGHMDFEKLAIGEPVAFEFDARLMK